MLARWTMKVGLNMIFGEREAMGEMKNKFN